MAAPSYTVDLVDISLAESTTDHVAYGGGASGLGAGADFSMQGVACVDKQITNAEKGILFNNGAPIAIPTDEHLWTWHFTATPGVTDNLSVRGVVTCYGDSTGNFVKAHHEGLDTFGAVGRVGKCYISDPSVITANTGSIPYRTLVGSPNGDLQYFGSGLKTTATVKAANMGLDAQRYGKGGFITAGDVATPATFTGFALQSDAIANRWGVLTKLSATSFELQGLFAVGQNAAGIPTQSYFKESNKNITIVDTPHSQADFTRFILDHALSESHWENINLTSEGTNNRGKIDDIAGIRTLLKGSVTGFGVTNFFDATSWADGHVWRSSDTITLNGAPITGGSIETSIGSVTALIEDNLAVITKYNFIGNNDIHAVDMPTLIVADTSLPWDNTFDPSTYAAVDGATGSEVIRCNVDTGFTLTINVEPGATTPTINNIGGGTVNVVAGLLTLTVNGLVDGQSEVRIRDGSFTLPGGYVASVSGTLFSMTFAPYAVVNHVTLSVITPGFDYVNKPIELFDVNVTENLTLTPDPSWVP